MQSLRHRVVTCSAPVELSTALFWVDKTGVMAAGTFFSFIIGGVIFYTKTTLSAELTTKQDARFDRQDAKLDKLDAKFDAKFESQSTSQLVLIGVVGIFCLVIGTVAVLSILTR